MGRSIGTIAPQFSGKRFLRVPALCEADPPADFSERCAAATRRLDRIVTWLKRLSGFVGVQLAQLPEYLYHQGLLYRKTEPLVCPTPEISDGLRVRRWNPAPNSSLALLWNFAANARLNCGPRCGATELTATCRNR